MSMLDSPTRLADDGITLFNLETAHQLVREGHAVKRGSSKSRHSELAVIVKRDDESCPTAVYNELVAARLGELIGVPVPTGVLAEVSGEVVYASLAMSKPDAHVSHVDSRLARVTATKYPWEAAGLFVFDVLIGNWDRLGNVKAVTGPGNIRFLVGFDHANSLLMASSPRYFLSTKALRDGCPVLHHHMFARHLSIPMMEDWLQRIAKVPADLFCMRCFVGRDVNIVDTTAQDYLASALEFRLRMLRSLCHEVLDRACSTIERAK
ncbi:hypothetical protein NU688_30025 [Variovorax sp. ZS18.2.2]|uniref:hypothetical protein n=1 Tax=Variovorax sp. ZS18.2.2 TaxID=2971255 RepID=UPI0021515AF1|nr:hypothetical protein [Variovorax sp. ZS18.2.2]MCR6480425.1 hypothetical protein [Variovorax sp. ZS18.2.2]